MRDGGGRKRKNRERKAEEKRGDGRGEGGKGKETVGVQSEGSFRFPNLVPSDRDDHLEGKDTLHDAFVSRAKGEARAKGKSDEGV
ncbi:hypothetical protein E2C01_077671 [Portunus trituberculatus]|uniref:Uncharacterized protein n=1 Tax=Portunus trituberculatus TaxID=210409 RepID=A0A5B7IGL3_PORTR|nr:hypothetical protein [Portunus trituberculatus]